MTATTTAPTRARRTRRSRPEPRRDIQGLRALAVTVVVANHLTGWPKGGFVGVDVFFVVSGFLITGLLLREHDKTGTISFTGFYRRRAKRILPAAILVLAATVVASHLVFTAVRAKAVLTDATWALFFGANWHFEQLATDYFSADRAVSPVQHYWSLSIEEQFYFVWPWLLLGIFAMLARRGWSASHGRVIAGLAIGAVTAASFAWAVQQTDTNVAGAYFSSLTRVWELGVGAALAIAAGLCARLPDRVRPALAWVGLGSVVAATVFIDPARAFPAPAAAWPVLSTALVIAAGTGVKQQRKFQVLTNKPTNYVGDASYSLYLWHFPVIVIGAALIGTSAVDKVMMLAAMTVLAGASYELYENPLRRANWAPRGAARRVRHYISGTRAWQTKSVVFLAAGVGLVCVYIAAHPVQPPRSISLPTADGGTTAENKGPTYPPKTQRLQEEIAAAVESTSWPDLDPSFDEVIGGPESPADVAPCGVYPLVDREACTWGPVGAPKSAVVVGDSVALAYVEPIRDALSSAGYRVTNYATAGCAFTDTLLPTSDKAIEDTCDARKDDAVAAINEMRPDLVLVTNNYLPHATFDGDTMTQVEWSDSTLALVNQFDDAAEHVVFFASPPVDKDIETCYTRQSVPADCTGGVTSTWLDIAATEKMMADDLPNGTWLDSRPFFCAFDYCPAYVGTVPVKLDQNHITQAYGQTIAPALLEQLRALDVV